ncbi:MAG: phosphotransferase, partial [Leptolyngbyaceae cyanobacterium SL_7_1]|nr:phosphotransferase [Leptolyngbyaceae cyanobacterium SL_7_1]
MTEPTLPPLIQQMLRPEFYAQVHPTDPSAPVASIQLVQTHISYVLLTGEYAYKVKKPLDFGFLNYTTLEKRRHFCEEELRLNQRGAPILYLAVVPITQAGTADHPHYQLNGTGEVVEYAVQMRQFPQETLLSALFDRGELTESLMQELAKVVADFHQTAITTDYIRSFGEVTQVRQAFDENYEQTQGYIGRAQTQQQFDETRAYTDRFFAEQKALFDRRMAAGWIRECHGDLHLRNICYWHEEFLLFDCIEFNEPFRFVDVMFDIAYIIMDLEARQRPDLSTIFLNTYVEQTGDWEGLQVLPIYVSRQTYVRAKVTSFLLDDPGVSAEDKQVAAQTAANYYTMAWR